MKKLLFLLCLIASPAFAAVTANNIITCQAPVRNVVQFLQGTDAAGTYKTLETAGTNGSDVISMIANTNDASAAHLVTCQIVNGGVKYGGVAVNVPVNAGFATAVPPVALLNPILWPGIALTSDGNPLLRLNSGDTIQCTYATALTSTDVLNIIETECTY